MSQRSIFLTRAARRVVDELSHHPVLSRHWQQVSVTLKGSTARGNADRYSDIDLVLYCDNCVQQVIVAEYYRAGLTQRQDGIFMFFAGIRQAGLFIQRTYGNVAWIGEWYLYM
jgi:hypothetical protein